AFHVRVRQQRLNQRAHPGRGVADPLQVRAAGLVQALGRLPLQQRRELVDRAQRRAQVVRDAVGQQFLLPHQRLQLLAALGQGLGVARSARGLQRVGGSRVRGIRQKRGRAAGLRRVCPYGPMATCRAAERRVKPCHMPHNAADARHDPSMALTQFTFQQGLFLLILAGGLYLFISERLRIDVTAMLLLLVMVLTGVLDPTQALSGFASEPAIIVAAVFVISGALAATGITEHIGQGIGRAAGRSEARAIAVVMPAVAALAAFSHHVMVTAMMLPILLRYARERQLPASRLLMPMSLAASLGTTLTLVSAPAFLLADNMLSRTGSAGLGLFSITPIGIALVVVGMVYMQFARWLLPRRSGGHTEEDYLRLERYHTELLVVEDSRWNTRPLAELQKALGDKFRLRGWLRDGKPRADLGPNSPLLSGDILLVDAAADELLSLHDDPGVDLLAITRFGQKLEDAADSQLVQAVVAPGSEFLGRSIRE